MTFKREFVSGGDKSSRRVDREMLRCFTLLFIPIFRVKT